MKRDRILVPLSRDHHHALALCVSVGRALEGAGDEAAQAATIVREFDARIREHFEIEERALFPAAAALTSLSGLVAELIAEHRLLLALVEVLRAGGNRADIDKFCSLLRAHVRKEENLLFEELQRLLTREQLDQLEL
jgi:hemerythrin-like domain-containing protein